MKNKLVKMITGMVALVWAVSACLMDSESWIPFIVWAVCTVYLGLFSYANNWFEGWDYEDRRDVHI